MKRTLSILLVVCLMGIFMTGCATKNPEPETADYDLTVLASALESSDAFSDILSEVDVKIASALYGFDKEDVAECILMCSTGATTEEIGLFKCVDDAAAARVLEAAQKRVTAQHTAYESYAPAEMPKLDNAIVRQEGVYVFYVVAADDAAAEKLMK